MGTTLLAVVGLFVWLVILVLGLWSAVALRRELWAVMELLIGGVLVVALTLALLGWLVWSVCRVGWCG